MVYEDIKSIGTYHDNPLHNIEFYEVKYHNGELAHIESNIIADNMFAQVGSEGYHFQMVDKIQDHYSELSVIPQEQGFVKTRSGNLVPKKITRG